MRPRLVVAISFQEDSTDIGAIAAPITVALISPTFLEIRRAYIEMVLKACKNNKSLAAEVLGIDRRTLYRYLEPECGEPYIGGLKCILKAGHKGPHTAESVRQKWR